MIVLVANGVFQVWWLKRFFEVGEHIALFLDKWLTQLNRLNVWSEGFCLYSPDGGILMFWLGFQGR